jgi:hypothetical protein
MAKGFVDPTPAPLHSKTRSRVAAQAFAIRWSSTSTGTACTAPSKPPRQVRCVALWPYVMRGDCGVGQPRGLPPILHRPPPLPPTWLPQCGTFKRNATPNYVPDEELSAAELEWRRRQRVSSRWQP